MSTASEATEKSMVLIDDRVTCNGSITSPLIPIITEIIETEYKHVEDQFMAMEARHDVALLKRDEAIKGIQAFTRDLIKAAEGYMNSHQHPVASFTHRIDTDKIDLLNACSEAKKRS